jgi:hypothetical protein
MQATFLLAGNFNVTPFEIMREDVDEVIMIINYLAEIGSESRQGNAINATTTISEKEQDRSFWAAL